jgi:hypothetical protein
MIEVAFIGNVKCLDFDGSKSDIPPFYQWKESCYFSSSITFFVLSNPKCNNASIRKALLKEGIMMENFTNWFYWKEALIRYI